MKQLHVRDRVMMSHYTCTSGTFQVLTVALLQRLKMEVLILSPANCEVQSMIKFLNAQSIAPIEIHRQLCQVYGHTWLDSKQISCRSSPYSPYLVSCFHHFLHLKKFLSGQRQCFQNNRECHTVIPIPGGRLL